LYHLGKFKAFIKEIHQLFIVLNQSSNSHSQFYKLIDSEIIKFFFKAIENEQDHNLVTVCLS